MTPLVSRASLLAPCWRRRLIGLAAAGTLLALTATPILAAANDPVVARVNGFEIKQSDLAIAEEDVGPSVQAGSEQEKQGALVDYLTDMILLAQAAQAKGLGSTTEFARRLELAKSKMLMGELLKAQAKTAVTDAALHQVYDKAIKGMGKQEEVRARHILVATEDEAKAVLADLKKGADFAKLAKQKSKDPTAASNGGELGYFTKDQMVPEFADAAFKLGKGELSAPVKTKFGWHIIQVEDKRTKPIPTFEQVKPQLEQFVIRKAQADLITKLRADAKIEKMPAAGAKK